MLYKTGSWPFPVQTVSLFVYCGLHYVYITGVAIEGTEGLPPSSLRDQE